MLLTPDNPGFHLINGNFLSLDNMSDADYTIEDVATVLGRKQRFNDHIPDLKYSVAEHCYHASFLYAYNRKGALMHDAAEWLTGDIPTPIKQRLQGIKEVEDLIDRDLQARFNYEPVEKFTFKVIDNFLFQVEHHLLFDTPEQIYDPSDALILEFWDEKEATKKFIERFHELSL